MLISETRGVGIMVYRDNEWAPSGGMGNVMLHHDRTNSMPRQTDRRLPAGKR